MRPELLLLSSSLDMEDCCWEQRMRTGERGMVNGRGVEMCVCVCGCVGVWVYGCGCSPSSKAMSGLA